MREWLLILFLAGATSLRAEFSLADIIRIHLEVIGGKERIDALGAIRGAGYATSNGKKVHFSLISARPNRMRLETEAGGRTLMQGYDGQEPPWEFDTGTWPPRYRPIGDAAAKRLIADAEFDDPLVGGEGRGYAIDLAGNVEADGKQLLRLLVTHKLAETFSLLLDPDTFLITMRVEARASAAGRKLNVVTRYDQYRPVNGVLMPHEITVSVDGRVTEATTIDTIEPNPPITDETFSRPKAASVK